MSARITKNILGLNISMADTFGMNVSN